MLYDKYCQNWSSFIDRKKKDTFSCDFCCSQCELFFLCQIHCVCLIRYDCHTTWRQIPCWNLRQCLTNNFHLFCRQQLHSRRCQRCPVVVVDFRVHDLPLMLTLDSSDHPVTGSLKLISRGIHPPLPPLAMVQFPRPQLGSVREIACICIYVHGSLSLIQEHI